MEKKIRYINFICLFDFTVSGMEFDSIQNIKNKKFGRNLVKLWI